MNLETISWQRALLWLVVFTAPIIACGFTAQHAGWGLGSMWLLCWVAYPLRHHKVFDQDAAPRLTDAEIEAWLYGPVS